MNDNLFYVLDGLKVLDRSDAWIIIELGAEQLRKKEEKGVLHFLNFLDLSNLRKVEKKFFKGLSYER